MINDLIEKWGYSSFKEASFKRGLFSKVSYVTLEQNNSKGDIFELWPYQKTLSNIYLIW